MLRYKLLAVTEDGVEEFYSNAVSSEAAVSSIEGYLKAELNAFRSECGRTDVKPDLAVLLEDGIEILRVRLDEASGAGFWIDE